MNAASVEARVEALLAQMSLDEKIGQLAQLQPGHDSGYVQQLIREGRLGAILNEVDVHAINHLQHIAVTESRLGIPLLVGRDVVHGFHTILPIPLGQAATWNPTLVEQGAHVAATEAAACGINWTFAPMVDIARDPRWGRVAESLGEDPHLAGVLGAAMVRGFQGDDLSETTRIAACAKHFAGYGASESGRDYNTTNIPENELRNVYLPPFKAAVDAGVVSLMTSFSDLNGVPASANALLLTQILRDEWQFDGFVVSDWESIRQLAVHGFTEGDRESAYEAATAGLDMEMTSTTYAEHLASLVHEGRVPIAQIDRFVANILRAKVRLGLFERPYTDPAAFPPSGARAHLDRAYEAALESVVLLENGHGVLPLSPGHVGTVAVIGPLADDPYEQLGTWVFDGDPHRGVTLLQALRGALGDDRVVYARGVETTRSHGHEGFAEAIAAAEQARVVVLCLGEESILSGEAHCRADIGLPGAQTALIEALAATGKPLVLVLMTGRPLALERVLPHLSAVLCAWHPGCMGGRALADLLLGVHAPSGKLPVTFPRVSGQVPMYYAHKHTGKPPTPETFLHIDHIPVRAPQLSVGNTSFHLDAHYTPLWPFGFGLSYVHFAYENLILSTHALPSDGARRVHVDVTNTGDRRAAEVVQLYVRDLVGNVTRPVRELKAFRKVWLDAGERRTVSFVLTPDDLAFYGRNNQRLIEPGRFHLWVGGSSTASLHAEFVLNAPPLA